jgi:hypothetical protein
MNVVPAVLILGCLLSLGCDSSTPQQVNPSDSLAVPYKYEVHSQPGALKPGQIQVLEAAVFQGGGIGATPCEPQWGVREPDGGTLAQEVTNRCNNLNWICAKYTASMIPGTYHVDVQEKHFPGVKTTFVLVVAP